MRRRKKIVIATAIVLGIAVYFYVMLVCLFREQPSKKVTASQRQETKIPKQEEVTAPRKQVATLKPSRPAAPFIPAGIYSKTNDGGSLLGSAVFGS